MRPMFESNMFSIIAIVYVIGIIVIVYITVYE